MQYQWFAGACIAAGVSLSAPQPAIAETAWTAHDKQSYALPVSAPPRALPKVAWRTESTQPTALSYSLPKPAYAKSLWPSNRTQAAALQWELGYLALWVVDTVQTVSCLERGLCVEGNPLWGKNPEAEELIAARIGLSLLHFGIFNHINERDPKAALRFAQVSGIVQGGVVLMNARFSFK